MEGSNGRRYAPEFIQEAVRLAREGGKSRAKIAKDLGVSQESLRRWALDYDEDGRRLPVAGAADRAEIARLRRELRVVTEEREILKKVSHALLGTTKDENPRYRSTFLQPDI